MNQRLAAAWSRAQTCSVLSGHAGRAGCGQQLVPYKLPQPGYDRACDGPYTAYVAVRGAAVRQPPISVRAGKKFALLDEGAIRREIGGPDVMRGQLEHLVELAKWPNICMQVVPFSARAHPGLAGPIVIASFKDAPDVAYLDTALLGQLVERPDDVCALALLFDTLRGEALPCRASIEMIEEAKERWT